MTLEQIKRTVAAGYVVTIVAVGIATGLTSPAAWVALTALALLPAAALLTLWVHPTPTLSESIQAGRR